LSDTLIVSSDSFPEKWKQEFEGLLYLGYLRKEVLDIPFHKFVVRTLTINEKLEISLLTKEYVDTIGYGRAYRAAVVAAGLETVDGRTLLPSNKGTNVLRQKFEYVINSWYDAVIDVLFKHIDELEGQVLIVLQELGIYKSGAEVVPIFEDEVDDKEDPKGGK